MRKILLFCLFFVLASAPGYCREKKAELQLTIKSFKETYSTIEDIRLDVTLTNNSNKELVVFWSKDSVQLVSDKFMVLSAVFPQAAAEHYETVYIKPKTAVIKKVRFANALEPIDLKYKLTMSYEYPANVPLNFITTSRQKIWTEPVISNTVTLSVVKADKPPVKVKVVVDNPRIMPEVCQGCPADKPFNLPVVKLKAVVANMTDDDLELYGLGPNDHLAFWATDVKNNFIENGAATKFDFNKPLDFIPTTTLKAHGEIIVPLELWPRLEPVSMQAAQKIDYHLIFSMVTAEDYPAKNQFELHHLYNDFWDPKSKMKDTVRHLDIVSDPFSIEILAVDPLSIKPAQPPVYKTEWQGCKDNSECIAVREGYNWTCVNKVYEKEARYFCRYVDQSGEVKCLEQTIGQLPALPSPVCSQGQCFCEDVKTWTGGPQDECLDDQDCVLIKGGNWESINKKYEGKRYQSYYGAACSDAFRYPPPKAFCFNGKCTMGDDKSKMFFRIFE